MDTKSKQQYKAHKIYRWIALGVKITMLPILQIFLSSLNQKVVLPLSKKDSTLGAFIALFITLIVYYAIIFILNRTKNFHAKTDLKKSIAVYILVTSSLFTIELLYANPLKNYLYSLTNLGVKDSSVPISLANAKFPWVFILIGLFVTLLFSFITKYVTFILFKKVLSKQEVLDRI